MEFRREYLVRLPLPLAQLYSRAHNAKDARTRHDNAFYLCEALIKLAGTPLIACYLDGLRRGDGRVPDLDRLVAQLALPSLGQWLALLRELARHFGGRPDAASHPLGHVWDQLSRPRRDLAGLVALYRRIKNGVDGQPAGDQACSVLQALEALVQYRNAVFGHGGPRFESFFEKEMGPLLFPAVNELLQEGTLDYLGPRGSRLVYLTEIRQVDERRHEAGARELIGLQSERQAPLALSGAEAQGLLPNRVCVLWPGRAVPVRLDPLLVYREAETAEEVLFLNRDRNGKQAEYLSYTTGRTERDKGMAPALAELLSHACGRAVSEEDLESLATSTAAETPSVEGLFQPAGPAGQVVGDYELLAELGRGGMGVVYLARQLSLGRLVALKMLPGDLAGDETALARFRREIRQLASCDHPNIVKVLASGTLPDGRLFYAMEYILGCDLDTVWRELADKGQERPASTLGRTTWTRAVVSSSHKQREHLLHRAEPTRSGRADASVADTLKAAADAAPPRPGAPLPLPPLPEVPVALPEEDAGGYVRLVVDMVRQAALGLDSVHKRHVVHRDVKPANLMLTADSSRVVLMDFGLAKGDSVALTASRQGGFLGTLRYAAPEQLAASVVDVGPAADVRALGAVLWELLTRRRLFAEAADESQLAVKVLTEEVPPLRRVDPALDRDLEAIVVRATERDVGRRLQTAGQLAEYLGLYLEGKPLPIRPPGARELMWRWVKGHKEKAGLIAALVLLALSAVAFGVLYQYDRQQRAADQALQAAERERGRALLHQQIEHALDESARTREGLQKALQAPGGVLKLLNEPASWVSQIAEARAACRRARDLWNGSPGSAEPALLDRIKALDRLLQADERDYLLAQDLEKVRLELATVVEGKQELERAADGYARAFRQAELPVTTAAPEAAAAGLRPSPVLEQVVAALDHWAWVAYALRRHSLREGAAEAAGRQEALAKQLLGVARLCDPSPWKDRVRDPGVWSDPGAVRRLVKELREELRQESPGANVSSSLLEFVAGLLDPNDPERVLVLRDAQARYPADFRLNLLLGQALLGTPHPEEGVGFYRAAVAVRPKSAVASNNFGVALQTAKQFRQALAAYDRALRLQPDFALAWTNKGNALQALNQPERAVAAHREAIRLDPTLAVARRNLGNTLDLQKNPREALAAFQEALKLDAGSWYCHYRLAILYFEQQRPELADSHVRQALDLQPRCAAAWDLLGQMALKQKDWAGAERALSRALEIDPALASAHCNLGRVCQERKDLKGAEEHFRKAVSLEPDRAEAYQLLGGVLQEGGAREGAVAAYRRAAQVEPSFDAFTKLGGALRSGNDPAGALAAYQKALDLAAAAEKPAALVNVGLALSDQRKYAEAAAYYEKAVASDPGYGAAQEYLGSALRKQGKFSEALAAYQKARELGRPTESRIAQCRRFAELAPRLGAILQGKESPKDAAERLLLGQLCGDRGMFDEAARLYGQAFTAEPKLADVADNRYNAACYAALAAAASGPAAPPDAARAALRRQALTWLKGEYEARLGRYAADPARTAADVRNSTGQWLTDADLSSVREPQELARLGADERSAWLDFWARVKGLHQLAREGSRAAKPG